MQGVVLADPGAGVVARCLEAGLLVNCTAERVVRLTPPLVVTPGQIDEALDYTYEHRRLSVNEQAAWQIIHGALAKTRNIIPKA